MLENKEIEVMFEEILEEILEENEVEEGLPEKL